MGKERGIQGAVRVRKRIEIEYSSDGPPVSAFIEDISESGAFIDTAQPLPSGKKLRLSFNLPDSEEEPVRGDASVIWTDTTGMGIRFEKMSKQNRERIRFFVAAVFFGQPPELPKQD